MRWILKKSSSTKSIAFGSGNLILMLHFTLKWYFKRCWQRSFYLISWLLLFKFQQIERLSDWNHEWKVQTQVISRENWIDLPNTKVIKVFWNVNSKKLVDKWEFLSSILPIDSDIRFVCRMKFYLLSLRHNSFKMTCN